MKNMKKCEYVCKVCNNPCILTSYEATGSAIILQCPFAIRSPEWVKVVL